MLPTRLLVNRLLDQLLTAIQLEAGDMGVFMSAVRIPFEPTLRLLLTDPNDLADTTDGPLPISFSGGRRGIDPVTGKAAIALAYGSSQIDVTTNGTNMTIYGWYMHHGDDQTLWAAERFATPLVCSAGDNILTPPRIVFRFPDNMFR